jgi:hypothetical protein
MNDPPEKRRRPGIGFAGILIIILGTIVACSKIELGIIIAIVGTLVLGYALLTGNVKIFG